MLISMTFYTFRWQKFAKINHSGPVKLLSMAVLQFLDIDPPTLISRKI